MIMSFLRACAAGLLFLAPAAPAMGDENANPHPGRLLLELPTDEGIVATVHGPGTVTVWSFEFESSGVELNSRRFAIHGQLTAEQVQGEAYLELLCTIDGNTYFSRTLSGTGAMQRITGTMDTHRFATPFDTLDPAKVPSRIELRIVMPQAGTITIENASLISLNADEFGAITGSSRGWWTDRQAGLIGGLGGAGIGVLGGVIGVLASRRKARSVAKGLLMTIMAIGVSGLIIGGAALLSKQPYAVWYPPLLLGVLSLSIGPFVWRSVKRQYESHELQCIAALDA